MKMLVSRIACPWLISILLTMLNLIVVLHSFLAGGATRKMTSRHSERKYDFHWVILCVPSGSSIEFPKVTSVTHFEFDNSRTMLVWILLPKYYFIKLLAVNSDDCLFWKSSTSTRSWTKKRSWSPLLHWSQVQSSSNVLLVSSNS